jgi:hypothetical protein
MRSFWFKCPYPDDDCRFEAETEDEVDDHVLAAHRDSPVGDRVKEKK